MNKNKLEILSVKKKGADYAWFRLNANNGVEYTVYGVKWKVNDELFKPTIDIHKLDEDGLEVEECTIEGHTEHLKNLMYALGWSIPEKIGNIFENNNEEL